MANQPPYLSTEEAAALLGVKRRRVQQLALAGAIPALKVGRDYLIPRRAIEAAKGRKVKPGPAPKKIQNSA